MQHYNKFHLERQTIENECFRHIVSTTPQMQLVLMSLEVRDEAMLGLLTTPSIAADRDSSKSRSAIPEETHENLTQFIYIVQGNAKITINGEFYLYRDGDAVVIPQDNKHRVENIGAEKLKLYTIYSPPHHKKDTC